MNLNEELVKIFNDYVIPYSYLFINILACLSLSLPYSLLWIIFCSYICCHSFSLFLYVHYSLHLSFSSCYSFIFFEVILSVLANHLNLLFGILLNNSYIYLFHKTSPWSLVVISFHELMCWKSSSNRRFLYIIRRLYCFLSIFVSFLMYFLPTFY